MEPMKIKLKENATDPDMVELITQLPSGKVVMWGTVCTDMLDMEWRERLNDYGEMECQWALI